MPDMMNQMDIAFPNLGIYLENVPQAFYIGGFRIALYGCMIALGMMLVGALGMKAVPAAYFGIVERFSVFAATGFNAALGIHLFCMKTKDAPASKMSAEQEAKNQ